MLDTAYGHVYSGSVSREFMSTSGEIWVLGKLNELTLRLGLMPTRIDYDLTCPAPDYVYKLYLDVIQYEQSDEPKLDRLNKLLGLEEKNQLNFKSLDDLNAVVDRALAVTPPLKARSR